MAVHQVIIDLVDGKVHTFRLGLGSCGREVCQLNVFTEGPALEVEQQCTDIEDPDYFGYPWHRVERFRVYHTDNHYPARNKQ